MDQPVSQTPQPIQTSTAQSTPHHPHHAVKRVFLVVSIVIFLLIVAAFSFMSLVTYASMKVPLLSASQEENIKLFMYVMPLTPKTPEQILLAAIHSNSQISTYNPEFSVSANIGAAGVSAASLDLKISGPVDFQKGNRSAFDLSINVGVNFGGTSYSAAAKLRKKDDTIYGKIDELSPNIIETYSMYGGSETISTEEINNNLISVFQNWAMYDVTGIDSEARQMLDTREADQSVIDTTRRKVQDLLADDNVLPEVKRLDDEDIAGVASYHLQINPTPETMKTIIFSLNPNPEELTDSQKKSIEEMIGAIDVLTIDVWFGKSDAILRKLNVQSTVALERLPFFAMGADSVSGTPLSALGTVTNPQLSTSMVLTIRDVGVPVTIDIPAPVLPYDKYWSLFQDALLTEEQKQAKAQKDALTNNLEGINNTLLKYYVTNGSYPVSISSVVTNVDISAYTYKRSRDGKNYILYIELDDGSSLSDFYTPYFGLSSGSPYSHQLSKYEFDEVL